MTAAADPVFRLLIQLDGRDLVVGALRQAADTRKRAATKAALEVAASKAAGNDARASAVKVVNVLADAARLEAYANALDEATPAPSSPPPPAPKPTKKTAAKKTAAKRSAAMLETPPTEPDPNEPVPDEPPTQPPPTEPPPVNLDKLADAAGLTDTVIEENGAEHGLDDESGDRVDGDVDDVLAAEGIGTASTPAQP